MVIGSNEHLKVTLTEEAPHHLIQILQEMAWFVFSPKKA